MTFRIKFTKLEENFFEVIGMKRIYSLDVLKLVFAYVIAFFHFGTIISPGPTITVQIFFIISGFFLAKKFYSRSHADPEKRYNQWNYTIDHVTSIYPHYLFSLVVIFGYMLARSLLYFVLEPSFQKLNEIALNCYNQIPDLLLLQSAYTFHDSWNYPLWQLSALVIAGYFVYGMLCWNEKRCRELIFPAAILLTLSLMNTGVDIWSNYGPIYIPLLRAFAPLCIGVLAYYFTITPYYGKLKEKTIPFNLAVLLSLVTIFAYADHANIFLVTTVILLWGCYDEASWINKLLNHACFRHCGSYSYAIYLNHALISRFLQAMVFPRLENAGMALPQRAQDAVYFAVLSVYSVLTLILVETWKKRRKTACSVK